MTEPDFEKMAAELISTGEYQVLRKLHPRRRIHPDNGAASCNGLFVDIEATGLDPARNAIIKLNTFLLPILQSLK